VSEDGQVDYESIQRTAAMAIRNVDSLIDRGFYPFDAIKVQNQNNRPIALGITGLASLFFKLRLPFTSPEAKEINKKVMAAIYYGAVQGSIESAKEHGAYPCFEGSPFSKGQFQFDLAGERPHPDFNWERLRQDMMTHGMRNSLLTGLPPAATTGSASMSTDSFEPNSSNIYNRKLRSGNFALVCEELVEDLMGLGLWNNVMADRIVKNDGSIQNIEGVPQSIKDIYKTVWELSQKDLIDMAVDRGLYVDQAQSLNVFFARPNAKTMSSSTFDAWRKGIKTLYYCRSKAAAEAVKTSLVPALEAPACAIGCDSCGV
jgi:ribonucleoside-diphosphate reductase alpha chain